MTIIIGGGASGMLCALLLARAGIEVTLIEKNKVLGRKLLATGNGRCNFTNTKMGSEYYYSSDKEALQRILNAFTQDDTIDLFWKLGILSRKKDGYVYPYSNQAITVVERLRDCCQNKMIKLVLETEVQAVKKNNSLYEVSTSKASYYGDNVVLACGGKAAAELGGTDAGYRLLTDAGHSVTPLTPALTGYLSRGKWLKEFQGVRIQGRLSVFADKKLLDDNTGEIQCTKTGISGIPAFQLSHLVGQALLKGQEVWGEIDFVPVMTTVQLQQFIDSLKAELTMEQILSGLVNIKCVPEIMKRGGLPKQLVHTLKHFSFPILDTAGFDKAQVTAGGVPLSQICIDSMESKIQKGMYIVGELLDVDGICGGYNLQWAWSSAYIAAQSIIQGEKYD